MEMLIQPYLRNWPEVERGKEDKSWDDVPDARAPIEAWQDRTGLRLPDDYKQFMFKFNGGRVYPSLLRHSIPAESYPSTEQVTILDPIYPWSQVEKIWNNEVFSHRNPPGMPIIASDPGGLEVLMSLEPSNYGQLFAWVHSLSTWGDDENNKIYPLANSFTDLLNNLFDNEDRLSYDYWYLPGLAHLTRKLEY